MHEIGQRRDYSEKLINELSKSLTKSAGWTQNVGCIYATGSLGRLEASPHSDVDAFIGCKQEGDQHHISNLTTIRIKAELIEALKALELPEFDSDGRYLERFTPTQLIEATGSNHDDAENTFTARLLLLLESRPIVGSNFHKTMQADVVNAYWRDFDKHGDSFVPAFFANDALRLWRTFCVNYEARANSKPEAEKGHRRTKNIKLRFSRIMTIFSALLVFLNVERLNGTVTHVDALRVFGLTPIDRLAELISFKEVEAALKIYNDFLAETNRSNEDLQSAFAKDLFYYKMRSNSAEFSKSIFEALNKVGKDTKLLPMLMV
ncbi:hypothetical protein [Paracoccus contaminans]|uniref:hypothetical protein n=1 Tax=Paracoccus contaminans TaxID=1945662 RepID=UPI0012F4DE7A|nr:hypothetical protein [Paracoccus contaminans]